MPKKVLILLILLFSSASVSFAQSVPLREDFVKVADSLGVLLKQRTGVESEVKFEKIQKRGGTLDCYFSAKLGDFPWYDGDISWFKGELNELLPYDYDDCKAGEIYVHKRPLKNYVTPALTNSGRPAMYQLTYEEEPPVNFVHEIGGMNFRSGMTGKHIALWQSHGRFFDNGEHQWKWMRAPLHTTVEDIYTQSYVIPFLIPMLENAGAYVITPRERDIQVHEFIVDNDPSFKEAREGLTRRSGRYFESGKWTDGGTGFADSKLYYRLGETPFSMGTTRMAETTGKETPTAMAVWEVQVEERGSYAVYVSYSSLPNSSEYAHYTVNHLGGKTEFTVNQKISGSTWVYLGTFEMAGNCSVVLDNGTVKDARFEKGSVVSADAVKIGGGIGKYEREGSTSGLPSFVEGALYWEQWAGSDESLTEKWDGDYTKDLASRGAWTTMMKKEKGVPVDLSLGFHSDAGSTPNDSIIGTLGIYTLICDKSTAFPDGKDRNLSRSYTDLVQTQVVNDIRHYFEPEWTRRETWDRSYSESRTTSVPGMILETLSHQNFADMKYGLDPSFRFTVSRSVYKGMLKFLSNMYGKAYVVQPLPVSSMAAEIGQGIARISWKATDDPLEPTADATGFILQIREGSGVFNSGKVIPSSELKRDGDTFYTEVSIKAGRIYSFRVIAYNEGGKSFPSETVCIGLPGGSEDWNEKASTVMVVNNFDRVSAPTWFDTPEYAGFDRELDSGVPYMYDISYGGENYQKRRDLEWVDNDNGGFGSSYTDHAGMVIAGNTFDFASVHGKALMDAGYAFYSVSRDAWCADTSLVDNAFAIDLICGKQVTTMMGRGAVENRYKVFPTALQSAIRSFTGKGGNIILSGAHIGIDVWDKVFPYQIDSVARAEDIAFVKDVLGYKWRMAYASPNGKANGSGNIFDRDEFDFYNEVNEHVYCAENVDGLIPASKKSRIVMRYPVTDVSAAVLYNSGSYKVLSVGFPLETLKDRNKMCDIFRKTLEEFKK